MAENERIEVWCVVAHRRGHPVNFIAGERPDGPNMQAWGGVEHVGHYELFPADDLFSRPEHWDYVQDNYQPIFGDVPLPWQRAHCPGGASEWFHGCGF